MRLSRSVLGTVGVVATGTLLALVAVSAQEAAKEAAREKARRAEITSLPAIPQEIHDTLQSGDFAAAVTRIDTELKTEKAAAPDYLLYLKGRAQTELGSFDDALATFTDLEKRFPESRWATRSRFGRGDVFSRQRNYRAAGEVYQAEAQRLLSDGRQDELTAIYLEFADRFFEGVPTEGPGSAKQPDYNQALTFYREALKLRPSRARRQKIDLRIARSLQELSNWGECLSAYQTFLANYASEKIDDGDRAPAELEIEARYQLGRAQLSAGQPAEARKTLQDFLASDLAKKAPEDLLAEATYRLAATHGIPAPANTGDLELGVAALEKFLKAYPKHKLAPQAESEIAQSYVHHRRYDQAIARLKAFIENPEHAKANQVAEARKLLGQSLYAQKKFTEAIAAWKEFLDKHPSNASWSDVQRQVIDAEYQMAEEQRRQKNFDAARDLWATFLNKYPLDGRAPGILFKFGQMKYAAAINLHAEELKKAGAGRAAGEKNDKGQEEKPGDDLPAAAVAHDLQLNEQCRKLFEEAMADWQRLASKYPGTNEASQAAFMIGVTLEDQLGKLEEALEAYKKVPGQFQSHAQQRIANLTAKQLEVLTERKFRSNEKPEIRLRTRNIESLAVKVYRIDMADYFRKMHLASGVETLDIALIDPDQSFDYKVEGYEKFRRLENSVAIPIEGAGVTAVTVSSDKLEATTMVIVSDIDIVAKSSRNELFVFAENMLTKKPADGVSLLVSNGEKVFAEELTNRDGVLQKSYDDLKSLSDLRVFAIHEGHCASTVTSLQGLDFAVGLSPKGYLYCDRPAYRAGQLVNLKGIVRWVAEDRYTFKEGEKYQLDVYDARGRVIRSEKIALGKFGTFADNFLLPETAPQGGYRVHLHQPGGTQSYETAFTVHEFKLEPIHITVDLPRKIYYRGETIEGKISLKYYYGTPLAGRTIQYQLADDRLHTAETDANGEVKFEFPTSRYSESQSLALSVQYPERGMATGETIFLATRGFEIGLETLRSVYLTGETFDTTVSVTDPAGKPVSADLKLEVIEETMVNGQRGERSIATHQVKSDEKTGKARQTLRLESSGRYILRATGTDRFGNSISGSHAVMISGEDDRIRLRILAEQHHYKVGDTATVQLHWREAPALALVTFEGASILGYQLVELKEGSNKLALPVEAKLAPNFELAVCVMEGNRFHQARSEFRVTRKLNIALKPDKTELKPGDELKVDVVVTDAQGKPVVSEVSLALVQKNLLDMFGDNAGIVDEFFGGGYRQVAVRATASSTFQYRPMTRGISEALLAESERREILAMELRARELLARGVMDRPPEPMVAGPGPGVIPGIVLSEDNLDVDADGNGSADIGALVTQFNELFREQRYVEAEILAQQAKEIAPSDPTAEVMFWKARFARRNNSDERLKLDKEESFWNQMDSVEMAATNSGGGIGSNARSWAELSQRRQKFRLEATDGAENLGAIGGFGGGEAFGGQSQAASQRARFSGGRSGTRIPFPVSKPNGETNGNFPNDATITYPNASPASNDFSFYVPFTDRNDGRLGERSSLIISQTQALEVGEPIDYFLNDVKHGNQTIVALNGRGELQVISGVAREKLQDMVRDGGLELLPKMGSSETGYWNPTIVTDEDGKATVTFRVPNRSTAWQLRSKGTDAGVLTGEATADVIAKKELFGELKTPLAFVAGDKANVLVEVHNGVVEKEAPIEVILKVTVGDKSSEQKRRITSQGPGMEEVSFPVEIGDGESAEFELTVTGGTTQDVAQATVPIRPYGMEVFATASGSTAQNTIVMIDHDKGLPVENPQLELLIGPSVNRTLLDAVIGTGAGASPLGTWMPSSGIERQIADVLGGVALLKMTRASRTTDTPEAQALAGRVQSAVSGLTSSQRDDGGWSWSGQPGAEKSDRFLTSRAVWALARARSAGFAVPNDTFNKGVQFLQTAFTQSSQTDREGQAILLHGLCEAGVGDFAHANRLYRERNNLSPSGLLHVALALAKLDRKPMAGDLLKLVNLPAETATASQWSDGSLRTVPPWMQSPAELRALFLLALEEVEPASAKAEKLADWLMAARRGARWLPEKANGPAVAALAEWFGRTKQTGEKYTLSVFVNDKLVEKFEVDPSKDATRKLEVPARMLVEGKPQRINLDMEGRGRCSYSAILRGFVPADKLKNTSTDWQVTRTYEPAQRMLDGQVIPRGFGILTGNYTSFRNPLTQLPMGERGEVTLNLWRHRVTGARDEQLDYLVVTEPLPAGMMVLPESIRGTFERFEIEPGAITFYLGDRPHLGSIHYTLVGYLPGKYRAAPTVLRSFYQPERIVVAKPESLDVLARGEKSKDEYKLTPVELYEYGKRLAAKRQFTEAAGHLTKLFKDWRLQDNVYQEVVQLLFKAALANNTNDAIVEYFEIIKEKYPEVEVDFESILKVAKSYQELGEYERCYLVYRATIEASFERESQIAGFLDQRGEFLRSVEVMETLLRAYPAEPYIATSTYALSQEVYGKAADAAQNAKLREAKVSRVDLIAASIRMLDHFLSTWPKDPAADQASFAMANAFLDLEQYDEAIARCEQFAERYPESALLDSFWYVIGFSQFARGNHDEALAMSKKVAETVRKDPATGVEVAAANKWQAIYIMGQVYHSLGKPADAIAQYEKVDDQFPDAMEAIDFFTRKEIKLPEVTTVKPNEPAKVPLSFRNVPEASVKVYRIDLLKFGLMQRNLDQITAINLAGIRPYHELTLKLGDGKDFGDREKSLDLPLKEEGAYLVVCRGENLYTSGLVLVSPLALEMQEEATSGRVRVTVKNAVTDKYVPEVHVKVIGTANTEFKSGETDLRGIFTADAIQGTSTVIARADQNRYAFYRGKTVLGNVPAANDPAQPPAASPQSETPAEGKPESGKDGLLKNLRMQNSIFNDEQRSNYRELLEKKNFGVKAKSAF